MVHSSADPAIQTEQIIRYAGDEAEPRLDRVAVEEPLEIRLAGCSVAVTMRTPGDDLDLAAGFLFTERALQSPDQIGSLAHCPTDDAASAANIVNLNPVDPGLVDPARWQRAFFVASSCGICGKDSIAAVRQDSTPITSDLSVAADMLYRLPDALRAGQEVFGRTGGLHAAGLFDAAGQRLAVREDVGRHNAVDKVIGHAFRQGMVPLTECLLMVSGRLSFEVVQKALIAGIPIVAAVSAPSSLAVDLARESGMTLVGFLRAESGHRRFNVYAGEGRIHA
ncbi:MAG TPA: formate dehydrogenase accessory sulfurtransferase FdhD [Chloroflexota bacterium]|nr:formate dehydrogenase accessory sulfurtransferase FdhD [Chloroflexota bacterium]